MLIFARAGFDRSVPVALLSAFRTSAWSWRRSAHRCRTSPGSISMAQFPIYLLPALLQPLAKRLHRKG